MELNDRKPLKYRGIMWLMALLGFAVMAISIWGCAAGQRPPESGKVPAAGQEG
ncbi:MAG: zinc ABC transporter substrate-binding protein, partial [Enterocloster bolteae]